MRCAERFDLQDLDIAALPLPPKGERIFRDAETPALALRLRASGARTWLLLTTENGKPVRRSLGDATLMPLGSVRRIAAVGTTVPAIDDSPATASPLFEPDAGLSEVLAAYLAFGAKGRWKASTANLMESIARTSILPILGGRRVADITRQEVARWHRDVTARTTSARMALSTLSGTMLYAEDHGLRPSGSNPCRGLRRKEAGRRGRHLPARTVRSLWQALDRFQDSMPDACDTIRLLLLTGARRREILGLRWDDIVGSRAVLEDSKTGPHTIWLNAPARAIFDARRAGANGLFVFPAPRSQGPITVIDRQWRTILEEAGISSLRLHDLRHHYASIAVSNGIDLRVVGQLLGHHDLDSTLGYSHLATAALVKSASRVSALIDRSMSGTARARSPSPKRCKAAAALPAIDQAREASRG